MKKLLIVLLALALLASTALSLVSCGGDGSTDGGANTDNNNDAGTDDNGSGNGNENTDEKVDYTVKVVDENGNGVPGVPVDLYVGPAKNPVELYTDSKGVATHKMKETNLPIYASLGILPEGYGDGESTEVDFAAGAKTATITVVKQIAYTVTFVDADGNGVAGVLAQVCVGDTCLSGKTTGETGKLVFYVNPGSENVSMQVNQIPESFAQTLVGTKQYYEADQHEIEIVLEDAV